VKKLTVAEQVLKDLGVTDPKEIDLEAIAWTLGVRIKYRPLDGCEACIAGDSERAIITVNSRSPRRRRRYSIGHELGHWKYHRGQILVCRSDDFGRGRRNASPAERGADEYAANLLMPPYLFAPIARTFKRLDFKTVRAMADIFDTSYTATAIKLVESGHAYALLVCHTAERRKWFTSTRGIPERWFPQDTLHPESSAFGILYGKHPDDPSLRKIDADAWFDRPEAARFQLQEQTMRVGENEILTLLVITDEAMLEERDAPFNQGRSTRSRP
jgi:Zn-dependent peptidase ImmA (M78 family)